VAGINYGLFARITPLEQPVLRIKCTLDNGIVQHQEFPLDEVVLAREAQRGGFWSYAAGVAYIFATEYHVGGIFIDNYKTTLPMKKGLSSSAAFCVLVARAFNRVYGLKLTQRGEMQAAYEGERLTPSQCGRMDQAVAFGSTPVVMSYDGDVLHVAPAKLASPLHIVLVDLGASKNTVVILKSLQQAFPHPSTPHEMALVNLLGQKNAEIIGRAEEALGAGDLEAIGALMNEAQALFDAHAGPLCPGQLGVDGSPMLHRVLNFPAIQKYNWGGTGVGSQGDGTAQFLCRSLEYQEMLCQQLESAFDTVKCLKITISTDCIHSIN
jgi:galactokinase